MTTLAITLAVMLGFTAALLGRSRSVNHRLHRKNKRLTYENEMRQEADFNQTPSYYVGMAVCEDGLLYPAAKRLVEMDGEMYHSIIKVFNTTDMEYNSNCARDLVDTLNQELCYD